MPEQHTKTQASDESACTATGHFTDRNAAELAAHAALNNGFTVQFVDRTTVRAQAADVARQGEAEGILAAYGATNLPDVRAEMDAAYGSGPEHILAQHGGVFDLVEEEVQPHQETVVAGEVHIRKNVVKETVTIEVPVEREELVIERVPVERRSEDRADQHEGSDPLVEALRDRLRSMQPGEVVRIPIVEEEVVIHKQPVVKSELAIGKRLVHEVKHFTDTVRREVPKVSQRGDVRVAESEGSS